MNVKIVGLAGAVSALALNAWLGAQAPDRELFEVQALASPTGPASSEPQLTTSSRGVLLSWIERTGSRATLKFSERTAQGWSAALSVASGGDWFINWADVPSVVRLPNGALAAHWLQKNGGDDEAYDVRLAYSKDDGRTWSRAVTPHHDGTRTEHGFASLFEHGDGLGVIWLDGRDMQGSGHDAKGHGAMSLRFASFDSSWKQREEMAVDVRVCECCSTSAVATSEGPLIAFRDRGEDELRNIHVARLERGRWTAGAPVHDDGWRISGCPVNGPTLSASGRTAAVAWFTTQEGQPRTYAAFSSDAGRTFGAPIRLDDARTLGRVDVQLLADGSAVATWMESAAAPGEALFRARRIDASGRRSSATTVATMSANRSSGFPRVAASGSELIFAWTAGDAGHPLVQTARAPIPPPAAR